MPTQARTVYVPLRLRNIKKIKAPSLRNRDIFTAVRVEDRSLRDVAQEYKLSHPRVLVIVRQVERWLGDTVGRGGTGDWLQRKGVAEYLHRERLHHLYGEALTGWHTSRQVQRCEKIVEVAGKPLRREVVEKSLAGDPRFLDMAMKVDDMRMKFDYESGSIQPPEEDEMHDQESISEATKVLQQCYYDRPCDEPEPEDARMKAAREHREKQATEEAQQQQLAEAESRRMLAAEAARHRAELAASEQQQVQAENVAFAPAAAVRQPELVAAKPRVEHSTAEPRISDSYTLTQVPAEQLRSASRSATGFANHSATRAARTSADYEAVAAEGRAQAQKLAALEHVRFQVTVRPIDVGRGVMVTPPRVITNIAERQKFIEAYWRERNETNPPQADRLRSKPY